MQEQIKSGIKAAMIAKDSVRLGVLRGLSSSFTNELVATGRMPQDTLTDDEVMAVIKREAKRRKDSIAQFEGGGRPDLAEEEKLELAVIEEFLPQMMSEEEITKIVKEKITASGEIDKAKMGMFIGSLMKDFAGRADGALVKTVVEKLLA